MQSVYTVEEEAHVTLLIPYQIQVPKLASVGVPRILAVPPVYPAPRHTAAAATSVQPAPHTGMGALGSLLSQSYLQVASDGVGFGKELDSGTLEDSNIR